MRIKNTGPFKVIMSLRLLKEKFEDLISSSNNSSVQTQAKQALELFDAHPVLTLGTDSKEDFF